MKTPKHNWTLREYSVVKLFDSLYRDGLDMSFLNIWFHDYKDERKSRWIKLCEENDIDWHILEVWEANVKRAKKQWIPISRISLWDLLDIDLKKYSSDVLMFWHWPEHISKTSFLEKLPELEKNFGLTIFGMPYWDEEQCKTYWNPYEKHVSSRDENDWHELWYKTVIIDDRHWKPWHITAWKFNKRFWTDLDMFFNKLLRWDNFSLSRFWDGELAIINWDNIDLIAKWEFKYEKWVTDELYRTELKKSFFFENKWYYKWIVCPCCWPSSSAMKLCSKTEQNLTWANIFVNWNYNNTLDMFWLEKSDVVWKDKKVILVVNEKADIYKLPWNIEKVFRVWWDCWVNNYSLIEEIDEYIMSRKDYICLFCCWPLANILCCKLWKNNANNTYLDCWSIFDTYMWLPATRWYHNPEHPNRNKVCTWN